MLYTLHQRPHSDAFSAIYSSITFRDSSSAVFFPIVSIYRFLHGNLSHILGQLLHGSIPSDYSSSRHLMLFRFLSLTQFPLHLILRDHLRPVLFNWIRWLRALPYSLWPISYTLSHYKLSSSYI